MTNAAIDLAAVNAFDVDTFVANFGGIFEHSPWVARAAFTVRPFGSVSALHAAMVSVVKNAGEENQLTLLRAHPELARPAALTASSASEQGGMGLDKLDAEEAAAFDAKNKAYREKFGFPFIIAVRGQRDRTAILAAMTVRLENSAEQELTTALAEVAKIARFRLDDRIKPAAAGRLTVHVLDTTRGAPAAGMGLSLFRIDGETRTALGAWHTNADGRVNGPVLAGPDLTAGVYEMVFDVAGWREAGEAGFYDVIPIRFRVVDPASHYHIPLLLSPFGYSTYRGS